MRPCRATAAERCRPGEIRFFFLMTDEHEGAIASHEARDTHLQNSGVRAVVTLLLTGHADPHERPRLAEIIRRRGARGDAVEDELNRSGDVDGVAARFGARVAAAVHGTMQHAHSARAIQRIMARGVLAPAAFA